MKLMGLPIMKSWLIVVALAAGLVGCSGGGGIGCSGGTVPIGGSGGASGASCGNVTPPSTAPKIAVVTSATTVTSASPATITATVVDASNAPVAGTVVNFSVTSTVGSLSATSALTDANGNASVLLSPATGANSGADAVVATATVDGTAITAQVGYQLSAVSAAFDTFTVDAANGGVAGTALAPYGQTQLTLTLTGVSSASPAALVITSDCVARGKATISPSSTTNTTGTATFIYKDSGGCGSVLTNDTVTASITGSSVAPATTTVYLTSPTVNSITFDTATPPQIFLKGSGYGESSTVKFKIVDTAGNPLPNQAVNLTLSTFAGGLTLDGKPAAGTSPPDNGVPLEVKTSDADGFVSAIVNSGTVPTPVRVIASLQNGVQTVSSILVVATGLPAQQNFSLSQQTINIEGAQIDGTTNSYTVRAADRSGNPVPDDTAIVFWSETGGQVHAFATTSSKANGIAEATTPFQTGGVRPDDGRVTVVAYAIGEESFVDLNGNNIWDANEPFGDLGDVLKDKQYDNHFDLSWDEFTSLQDLAPSLKTTCASFPAYPQFTLDASTPSIPGTCSGTWSGKTYVRQAAETVLSTSHPRPLWVGKSTNTLNEGLDAGCTVVPLRTAPAYRIDPTGTVSGTTNFYNVMPTTTEDVNLAPVSAAGDNVWWTGGNIDGSIAMLLADENPIRLNPMAAGTTITAVTSTDQFSVSIAGGSPVPNSHDATTFYLQYKSTGALLANVSITVTSPSGAATTFPVVLNLHNRTTTCAK
jgi:hypothetical protein